MIVLKSFTPKKFSRINSILICWQSYNEISRKLKLFLENEECL